MIGPTRNGWPADPAELEQATTFLRDRTAGRTVVVPDTDVDGLTAGLLVVRTLERLDHPKPIVVLPGRAEHVHRPELQERIAEQAPDAVIVLDMGSRPGPILPGVPTLVIDHHHPTGRPEGALLLTAAGRQPVATTSLLAWHACARVAPVTDLDWVALMGIVADLGPDAPFEGLGPLLARHGKSATSKAVALLNAPRRAPGHAVDLAWDVLSRATSPGDIARRRVSGVDRLDELRRMVSQEVARCARTAPLIAGEFALLAMHSEAKVHPLVAQRWRTRLSRLIVIAANSGWLPGRVNFAMRTRLDRNLLAVLRSYPLPPNEEIGHGHPGATGGSLPYDAFLALAREMGFDRDAVNERFAKARQDAQGGAVMAR